MMWLQNNSLPFLIVAIFGIVLIAIPYAVREHAMIIRKEISYDNFNKYKAWYNQKLNKLIAAISIIFIIYCLVFIVISATSNILRINLTVYISSSIIFIMLLIGNSKLPAYNKTLAQFENQYAQITENKDKLSLDICKEAEATFATMCEKIYKNVANIESSDIVKYDHTYFDAQKELVANKISEAKNAIEILQKTMIQNFNCEIHKYVCFGSEANLESVDFEKIEKNLMEIINNAYKDLINYVQDETCRQLNISLDTYFRLFGAHNVFNHKASEVECMYVVLKENTSFSQNQIYSLDTLKERKKIISAYEKLQENNIPLTSSVLKMILVFKKSVCSKLNLFDMAEMSNYYLQLKSNSELDSLIILLKLLALIILDVETDPTIFNSTTSILYEYFNFTYNKKKLKQEIIAKEALPKLARVVGHIEVERCTLDKILMI